MKEMIRLSLAVFFACAASTGHALVDFPFTATGDIFPWAPTPADHVIVTVYDTFGVGCLCVAGFPTGTQVSRDGDVITMTTTWVRTPDPFPIGSIYTIQADIGALPVGQYTVNYVHVDNLGFTGTTVSIGFTVSIQGYESAIEYFAPSLNHYFITSSSIEIAALDNGTIPGWQRTGESFHVIPASTQPTTALSVCRFYGLPDAGLDSHFYTQLESECEAVQQLWPNAWLLESSDVFAVPSGALCPQGAVPLYRLYNNRTDANHRFTTSTVIRDQMLANGWIAEGFYVPGSGTVAMCVPA